MATVLKEKDEKSTKPAQVAPDKKVATSKTLEKKEQSLKPPRQSQTKKKVETSTAKKNTGQPQLQRQEVQCSCGMKHIFYSAQPLAKLEICSQCHPFYTGSQKLVDSAGRVDKFKKKYKMK